MAFVQTAPAASPPADDVRPRFIRAYETDRPKAMEGEEFPGAASKSYFYDSKALEAFDESVMRRALDEKVPRCTLIEIARLWGPDDQQAVLDDAVAAGLGCREVRRLVRLLKQVRRSRRGVPPELIGAVGVFLAKHPKVGCPELRRVLPAEGQQAS